MYTLLIYHHPIYDTPLPRLPSDYFEFIESDSNTDTVLATLEKKPDIILCSPQHDQDEALLLALKLRNIHRYTPILLCNPNADDRNIAHMRQRNIHTLRCEDLAQPEAMRAILDILGLPHL